MLGGTVLDRVSSIEDLERENDFFGACGRDGCKVLCDACDLSGDLRWSLEILIIYSLSTCVWFVQNWNMQVACGTRSMMFVLTERNACKGSLFDMLCVVSVEQTCMICHHAPFCILTPSTKVGE
jgi:hypothetical protein